MQKNIINKLLKIPIAFTFPFDLRALMSPKTEKMKVRNSICLVNESSSPRGVKIGMKNIEADTKKRRIDIKPYFFNL